LFAAETEKPLALEKEFTLLGEEEIEAGEVDLLLVLFDLCEIRAIREIGDETLRQPVFEVEASVSREHVVRRR